MKRKLSLIFLQLLFVWAPLSGVVIETAHFSEITKYIKPNTLVILDIDDTLLLPVQTLGTDVWFQEEFSNFRKHHECSVALDMALAKWEAVRHLTNVRIVEEGTDKIIEEMQNQNITVMGLTSQGLALATRTIVQLKSLNIDLTKTAPSQEDHYFINQHGVLYRHGVLFTSGTPKGPALLKLLDIIGLQPEHIIFINDKETHVRDVEGGVESRNIPFTGLRYSHEDERVAAYDPLIADIQWNHSSFGNILSDEEAKAILLNATQ